MNQAAQRLKAALRTWPGAGWTRVAVELAWALPLLLGLAWLGGLAEIAPVKDGEIALRTAAILFLVPAVGEEILFRGLLIPRESGIRQRHWMILSTILFVLWHPLQAFTFGPPWASLFLNPWFLALAGVLGLALARIYVATQSLWPCILAHWAVVTSWKLLLGGPFGA